MSDGRALLSAICANPEEDTPRLAYADWLDEVAGALPQKKRELTRARAELIRVQCELAALPPEEEDADTATARVELEFREEALLKLAPRRRSWARPLVPAEQSGSALVPDSNHFVRGFPMFAFGTASDFIATGEILFDISPVHQLKCMGLSDADREPLLAQPWMARVRRATLGGEPFTEVSQGNAERLFAEPHLGRLEELELWQWALATPGAPVAARALASLRWLTFHGVLTPGAPANLARLGEVLPADVRLRELALHYIRYDAKELADLAGLPQLDSLERLFLGTRNVAWGTTVPLGAEAVRAVTGSPFWRTLRAFSHEIGSHGFTPSDIEVLAAEPPAPHLRTLALTAGNLGSGLAALASNPLLASITTLDLSRTALGDAGAELLAKSPHLGRLVNLQLAGGNIGPKGIKALAEAPFAQNLVCLGIYGCPIHKKGIDALVDPQNFPRLARLDALHAAKNTLQKNRLRERFGDRVRC